MNKEQEIESLHEDIEVVREEIRRLREVINRDYDTVEQISKYYIVCDVLMERLKQLS